MALEYVAVVGIAILFVVISAILFCRYLRRPAPKVPPSEILAIGHKFAVASGGRKIEYSISGDPNGVPVYYQHGYMCGCYVCPLWSKLASELGIKLIAASMPGFGYSDSYPLGVERSLLDWPADVKLVLDQEKISKIHLFGISAGGVHVAALAHGLPAEMVGNVCFICPTCPDHVPGATDHMAFVPKALRKLMGKPYIGDFIAFLITRLVSPRFFLSQLPDCKAALERADQELPELSQGFLSQFDHGLSFTYRGIADNAKTITAPPPFDLVELEKLTKSGHAVSITTAGDDTTNPYIMQQWFHNQIPGSTLMRFADGWGHLHGIPPDNFKRILGFLMTGQDTDVASGQPNLVRANGRVTCKRGYSRLS